MPRRSIQLIVLVLAVAAIIAAVVFLSKPGVALPAGSWHQTFGGTGNEAGLVARETADGGYIVAGVTTSFGAGEDDVWLVKTDRDGRKLWDKTFGGAALESVMSLLVLPDGYLLAGYTTSAGNGGQDAWLVRTDENGALLWEKTYGGAANDAANAAILAEDGGFVMAGFTLSAGAGGLDGWLFKTDASGNQLWSLTYGGAGLDYFRTVAATAGGGFALLGGTDSAGNEGDVWLVKTDAAGAPQWEKTYRGRGEDFGVYTTQATDGYLIAGTGMSAAGDSDFWLIKTGADGAATWSRTFGGDGDDVLENARATQDGGILLIGRTYTADNTLDIWLMKIDGVGNKVWEEVVGGKSDDVGFSVQETSDGGYIIAGQTASYGAGGADVWLVKVMP